VSGDGRVARWLARARKQAERRVTLEDGLFGGLFARYAAYRLFWVALVRLLGLGVHAVEFLFLARMFRGVRFADTLILVNLGMLAMGAWWGALDVQRSRIREAVAVGDIAVEVGAWMRRGVLLSAVVVVVAAVSIGWAAIRAAAPPILLAYLGLVAVRLAVDLVVRAYYSGVYAQQRVYRPPLAIVATEISAFAVVVAGWRLFGAWVVPLGLLVQLSLSLALLVVYTRRAYQHRGIVGVRLRRRRRPPPSSRPTHVWFAAAVGAATRLGSLLVVVVLVGQRHLPGAAVRVVHLMAPLLATAGSWPQVFYLDFRSLEEEESARLRDRLGRMLEPLGLVIGAGAWAIGAAYAVVILRGRGVEVALALAPLVIAYSWLARSQLRYFAQGEYGRVLAGTAVLLAIAATWIFLDRRLSIASPVASGLALAAASVIAAAVIDRMQARAWQAPAHGLVRALAPWMHALARVDDPVTVASATMPTASKNEQIELAERMAELLGEHGAVATRGRGLVWFERGRAQPRLPAALLVELSAGRVDEIRRVDAVGGGAALAAAAERGLLPDASGPARDDLVAEFQRRFPAGFTEDLRRRRPQNGIAGLDPDTRRTIWHEARVAGRGGRRRPQGEHEVTVYAPEGVIEIIFCSSRALPADDRRAWEILERAHAATVG